jgi:hypothetical protein
MDLKVLEDAVAATEGVEASAGLLITKLAAELADIKDDPAAIQALSDRLTSAQGSLAAAIAAVPA